MERQSRPGLPRLDCERTPRQLHFKHILALYIALPHLHTLSLQHTVQISHDRPTPLSNWHLKISKWCEGIRQRSWGDLVLNLIDLIRGVARTLHHRVFESVVRANAVRLIIDCSISQCWTKQNLHPARSDNVSIRQRAKDGSNLPSGTWGTCFTLARHIRNS